MATGVAEGAPRGAETKQPKRTKTRRTPAEGESGKMKIVTWGGTHGIAESDLPAFYANADSVLTR